MYEKQEMPTPICDLACECGLAGGLGLVGETEEHVHCTVSRADINNEASKLISKPAGRYVSLFFGNVWELDRDALDEISERNQRRLPPPTVNFKGIVGKERYPVTKKATELVRRLVLRGIDKLKNLFRGSKSRSEIVATFIAILELCKTNSVVLEDDDTGENPNVRLIKEPDQEVQAEEMT